MNQYDDNNLEKKDLKKEDKTEGIITNDGVAVENEEDNKKGSENNDVKVYCTKCGAILSEGQIFCGKCGTKINDIEQNENQDIEEKLTTSENKMYIVGEKTKKSKNKKYIIGLVAALLLIIVGVFINNEITKKQQEQEQAQARNEYLQNVISYQDELLIAGSNLEDIADTTQQYWHENIFEDKHGSDINEAIWNAFEDKSSEISQAREYNDDIKKLYIELKDIPEGSEDLKDLLNIISSTYNSYTDFYDLAIYPEGNYNQYSENNNQRTNDFLDSYRELENYIETDKEFTNLENTYK